MRLLIVGEHGDEVAAASTIAAKRGAKVRHAPGIDAALAELRAGRGADMMMIDVTMDVRAAIEALHAERIHLPVIAYGIASSPRDAVAAIKAGAREFLPLPPESDLISAILESVAGEARPVIFEDPRMVEVLNLASQYAPADASVLVTGESGTGKEMLSRFVHQHSRRAGGPFVSVNCAAIPDNLLESELFGHEKGAFTGAVTRRVGKFEEADGGTLLLDEITEMDIRLQAKLLRAVQEREIDRVGGTKPVKVDIRLIATSNRNLEQAVAEGVFREDLLFRLSVLTLDLPPLRDRPKDVEVLARHFAQKYARANNLPERPISAEALAMLRGHYWKGNVRELENCLHRAVLLTRGDAIAPEAVVLQGGRPRASASAGVTTEAGAGAPALVGRTVADVERGLIMDTLQHTLGNRTHAANILGISIRTLRNKLKQYAEEEPAAA